MPVEALPVSLPPAGFGEQRFGVSLFGWPRRNVTITVGPLRTRTLAGRASWT